MSESGANDILHVVMYLEVVPAGVAGATAALKAYRDAARNDAGILRFETLHEAARTTRFAIIAASAGAPGWDAHCGGPAASKFRDAFGEIAATPPDVRLHAAMAVGRESERNAPGALTVLTHVDVPPPRKDECIALLERLAAGAIRENGSLGFEVLQQTSRPNHFTVVENWANEGAYERHVAASGTRDFRAQLTPMSGALYDERIYRGI
jgi:quinol monooxygenase YgiN